MSEETNENRLAAPTAQWTAGVRAFESRREDRLFADPWAAALAGPEGEAWMAARPAESVLPIVLRTRFFDDFLQRVAHQHGIRQVVLMAAGLDTRAFRLAWPAGTQFFELDQGPVLAHKASILQAAGAQPACARQTVAADLTGPWQKALLEAGFDPARPAGWLLEGFLFYLPTDQVTRLLDAVSALAVVGSWIGFDIINGVTLTHPLTRRWIDMQASSGAPWIGTLDNPQAALAARGWQSVLSQAGEPDAHHGRWPFPVLPLLNPDIPHDWFVTAQKSEAPG